MKQSILIVLLLLSVQFYAHSQVSFYDIEVDNLQGERINLRQMMGKKLLFVTLPLQSNPALREQLDTLIARNGARVQLIGIVSIEDGYQEGEKDSLQQLYSGRSILLTAPQHTRKGMEQSPLLQWLTHRDKNHYSDRDVNGPGQLFFVSRLGSLYAVIPAGARLDHPMVGTLINRQL